MYDMYPWDSASQGDYPPKPLRSVRNPSRTSRTSRRDISPTQAVQVALDRRDNGGDALAAAGRPMSQPPAEPAAGRTRQ